MISQEPDEFPDSEEYTYKPIQHLLNQVHALQKTLYAVESSFESRLHAREYNHSTLVERVKILENRGPAKQKEVDLYGKVYNFKQACEKFGILFHSRIEPAYLEMMEALDDYAREGQWGG